MKVLTYDMTLDVFLDHVRLFREDLAQNMRRSHGIVLHHDFFGVASLIRECRHMDSQRKLCDGHHPVEGGVVDVLADLVAAKRKRQYQ
ncbi:WGR domain-containing protein [Roseovarius tibetensis]|uniref:WGR domain-containing protein n=1 Tax=Roseovarius tibetensis TaxID=2685897 RepID=UPI003D7F93F2